MDLGLCKRCFYDEIEEVCMRYCCKDGQCLGFGASKRERILYKVKDSDAIADRGEKTSAVRGIEQVSSRIYRA